MEKTATINDLYVEFDLHLKNLSIMYQNLLDHTAKQNKVIKDQEKKIAELEKPPTAKEERIDDAKK